MPPAALPLAAYRLQLNAAFTFEQATTIVDYLAALGISHCYASSYLKAVPGSTHGYDVCDPTQINPEIGTSETYRTWVARLREAGMGHIIDVVPNHMGIARSANPWWQDVLENGESSRYAEIFDIDWRPLKPELEHKVLLPVLGDAYGAVLERQEIRLRYADGAFSIQYWDQVFPIAPGTYDAVLSLDAGRLLEEIGDESADGMEFLSIITSVRHLPGRTAADPASRAERDREKEVLKRRLRTLTGRSPAVLGHIERAVQTLNGSADDPRSFDALDNLLARQAYRLAHWRVAAEEINYRRFFDINELAAIRMEDPEVFDRTHAFVFELLKEGCIDGFRVDHVDGLFDPATYLHRLQSRAREVRPDLFTEQRSLFLVVEKILGIDETLPDWPVEGTTGYDALVMVNGLFVEGRNERAMTAAYETFSRLRVPFREIAYHGKQLILRVSMASELNVLAHHLNRFSERNRRYRDFTLNSLGQAMREIIAGFPVYRSYVTEREPVSEHDRASIERAVAEARRRNPNRAVAVYHFVRDLLLKKADYIPERERGAHMEFVGRFQQVTSPVTAKGIEDTALYIYNRLVSLNEVGGEPDHFGVPPGDLHSWLRTRQHRWKHALSTSSTHDTKRSEDVRARLNVLSEIPAEWRQATARWARANRKARTTIEGESYPSRNEEYLLYQTLVGSWPLEPMTPDLERDYCARIVAYMEKAMREAKVYTSWINRSELHEQAMARFVETILASSNTAFRHDFEAFTRRVSRYGIYNSLAQLVLKVTMPGVPDFYQGTELWDFSLVDPDNRRPVDYERRRAMLSELRCAMGREPRDVTIDRFMSDPSDDRLKLFATATALTFRREQREIFETGSYEAAQTDGARRDHVFGFARTQGDRHVLVAVPRLVTTLSADGAPPLGETAWRDTRIISPRVPANGYHDVFSDRCIAVAREGDRAVIRAADIFGRFPVAVLEAR
jgi:(1->4)-alpha-D-glucan 1-alpha-D-glucosylmutase